MPRQKPVAVFDIDGTIFRSSLVIELLEELTSSGLLPREVTFEYQEEYQNWLKRTGSYEDYINAVVESFDTHTVGISQRAFEEAAEKVVKNLADHTYRYTRKLTKELKDTHFLLAISGSPIEIVKLFAKYLKFDAYFAKTSEYKDGKYTGKFQSGSTAKDETLKRMVKQYSLTLEASIGVGDTESDIAFLSIVDNPIAFNPNQKLLAEARKQGWKVVVERKDAIYELKPESGGYTLA